MKIIEREGKKPHKVYRGGGKAGGQSFMMGIPKNFALTMGLDEEECFVMSHLVIAYDNNEEGGGNVGVEDVVRTLQHGSRRKADNHKEFENVNNNKKGLRSKGKKVYLVVEKLLS